MNETALLNIKSVLEEWDFQVELTPVVESLPVQQLTIALEETNGLQMVIFFLNDLLKVTTEDGELAAELDETQTDFLQLFIRFPFELLESAYPDLARLILMINWSTPVGAFGLNEVQQNLYYRQVFECLGDSPDSETGGGCCQRNAVLCGAAL